MVQMWPFEQPIGQVRNGSLDDFKHAGLGNLGPIRANQIVLLRLNLKVVTKRALQADVVKGGHLVPIGHLSRVKNCPLGQLGNAVAALLVLLVLLDSHLPIPLEGEEEAFRRLQTDRAAEGHGLLRVTILEVQERQLFALAHFKIGHLKSENQNERE